MTDAEWEEQDWQNDGGPAYWQCGTMGCRLEEHRPAEIVIEWADGQCRHKIPVSRSITVREAKRIAAEWVLGKLAEWVADAESLRRENA